LLRSGVALFRRVDDGREALINANTEHDDYQLQPLFSPLGAKFNS
jgi:hypothetical protein